MLVTLIVEMSKHIKATCNNRNRMVEAAVAGAMWVSGVQCLVCAFVLCEFVDAKDRQV